MSKKQKLTGLRVEMVDKFMSGWGEAKDKKNLMVVMCATDAQAEQIRKAANRRSEMVQVVVTSVDRYVDTKKILVTVKDYDDLGGSWLE